MSVEDPKKDADRRITIWPQWLATCAREYLQYINQARLSDYVRCFISKSNKQSCNRRNQLFLNRCLIPIMNRLCIEFCESDRERDVYLTLNLIKRSNTISGTHQNAPHPGHQGICRAMSMNELMKLFSHPLTQLFHGRL